MRGRGPSDQSDHLPGSGQCPPNDIHAVLSVDLIIVHHTAELLSLLERDRQAKLQKEK